MKRLLCAILCFILILGAVPARADNDPFAAPLTSRFASAASMARNRDVFVPIERSGFAAPLTRAMTAEVLYAVATDPVTTTRSFSDVAADASYAAAASWAVESGILAAADDSFLPDQAITREQLAIAMKVFLDCSDMTLPEINETVIFFDTDYMSAAGKAASGYMQRGGVMAEASDGNFYPGFNVSVSQAETIFLRLMGAMRRRFMTLPVATVSDGEPVDDSWFEDVCFIGHSQVVAMGMYFHFTGTDYLAEVGFKAPDMLVHKAFHRSNGRYGSLRRLLENTSYGKVFVMLGINDVSDRKNRIEEFKAPMRQILDIVKETQPNAKLYLISLAPVGRSASYKVIYNPEVTALYCGAVKDLSREYDAEYIDFYRLLCDDEGYMYDEYAVNDGIHIVPKAYEILEEYLKRHTA